MNEARLPKACVIGWPVKHTRSPMIHTFWLNALGIAGAYELAEVAPEDFRNFVSRLSERGFVGANVTVPHKEVAYALSRHKTPTALALRAVNTLWIERGELHADNTDVSGFLDNLDECAPQWKKQAAHAVVLGAGGAARAVVFGLLRRGVARVTLVNRTVSRAGSVADQLGGGHVTAAEWAALPDLLRGADLLVNTTPLGMHGQPPLDVKVESLPAHCVVADIVYVPLETDLLRQAKSCGLRTVDGLGMLLHQATHGFERWFGVQPKVTAELRALVVADIVGR